MRPPRSLAAAVALAALAVLGGCAGDPSALRPEPASSTGATESPTGPFELSATAAGPFRFGSDAHEVERDLTERFGAPDVQVGPERYGRREGAEGWYADPADPVSASWAHPVLAVSCWRTLCLVFGGDSEERLALRGWELATHPRWAGFVEAEALPGTVRLAGTGVRLGDPWRKVHRAYPATVVQGAEGQSLAVGNTPWQGIFDGVAAWRLSGAWHHEHPSTAPPGARLTRVSAGEGPEPGCC